MNASETFWAARDRILAVYPELRRPWQRAERRLQHPGCRRCTRRAQRAAMEHAIRALDQAGRNFEPLQDVLSPGLLQQLRQRSAPPEPARASPGPRPSCLDCCRKHLAQAVVLLGESRLGYPHHRWLAIGHLAEASEETLAEYPALAADIRTQRLLLAADPAYLPDLMPFFDQVAELERQGGPGGTGEAAGS